MHLLQTQPLSQPVFGRVAAFFAAVVDRFAHSKHDMASQLGGHAWTDSLERELNNDIAICRRLRI